MRFHGHHRCALGVTFALAALTVSGRGHACGGCFHDPDPVTGQQNQSTLVVAHRMAVAISTTHTVLWDQVQYAGAPTSFAWVLPVQPGASLELSTDAWFETLDAATSTRIVSPEYTCYDDSGSGAGGGGGVDYTDYGGCSAGCGNSEEASGQGYGGSGAGGGYGDGGGGVGGGGVTMVPVVPPVSVVHQATVGPYETVTLHANVPNVLTMWLTDHGYAIDPSVQPIIEAYTAEGFDFIAMRLLPGQGVDRMKPVRVSMPGASTTLPLRMVAAGTGVNVAITLFVVGEGRYAAENFPDGQVAASSVTWDFDAQDSDYSVLRQQLLASGQGRTWNTAYAEQGALLSTFLDPEAGVQETYLVGGAPYDTIGSAYVHQGLLNSEGSSEACASWIAPFSISSSRVVTACDDGSGTSSSSTGGPSTGSTAGAGGQGTGGAGGQGTSSGSTGGAGGAPAVPVCGPNELDGRKLACGTLDDLAVALDGMHPRDVWVTRLESNLPRAALADDLTLAPAPIQSAVSKWILTTASTGDPCANVSFSHTGKLPRRRAPRASGKGTFGKAMIAPGRTPPAMLALAVAALAVAVGRRRLRGRR